MRAKLPRMYSEHEMNEFLAFHEMIFLISLHEAFGFGPVRLARYYNAIVAMDEHYKRYIGKNEPLFGRKAKNGMERMDLWAVKRDLAAIGVDYDALVAEGEAKKGDLK